MFWKWFPWRFLVRTAARRQGLLDPVKIISQLQNFAQPSEVWVPMELLRMGIVLHARGLMNSLAIQNNLDWIWPYWVECQYNPRNEAFIPRSFNLTQINLTHRNWTALGLPGCKEFPLVDPRGLVTPYYDGWSIDAWLIPIQGRKLFPSRMENVSQRLVMDQNLSVVTESYLDQSALKVTATVAGNGCFASCKINVAGFSQYPAQLVVSLRPYNPEGVSFINEISLLEDRKGWRVNKEKNISFDHPADQYVFSNYRKGDVYSCCLLSAEKEKEVSCKVGMASAAAIFLLKGAEKKEINISLALDSRTRVGCAKHEKVSETQNWGESLKNASILRVPDELFQVLYETAVYTMILHSPDEIYPGPYLYKRFWFRDAAFILKALLCAGLKDRVLRALNLFPKRQKPGGYFFSQEGEWDSNGQALWIILQYCLVSGCHLPTEWKNSVKKAANWICRKRLPDKAGNSHAGLMPSGLSAEHLGPNDYYYWDDFWSIAGLRAAADLLDGKDGQKDALFFREQARILLLAVERSLNKDQIRLGRPAIPASPNRRMDSGAIGSLCSSYPLQVFKSKDERVMDTADFLMKNCLVRGGFFHDMTHSGINPYLTLHLAQVLLRAQDMRFFSLMSAVAKLASPTGQWPESVHPFTLGGCMGDGEHVWASAEWVLMVRNCFIREEENLLILFSGIPKEWLVKEQLISFGPAPTVYGDISVFLNPGQKNILIEWDARWHGTRPRIEIRLPGFPATPIDSDSGRLSLELV